MCEHTGLHVCVRRKLHFELYDKVHMPDIAARPCGIYHGLYKVHYQPKSVRLAVAEHIQHVYPQKCWYGSCWEIVSQTHSCNLSARAIAALISTGMLGYQNSPFASYSVLETSLAPTPTTITHSHYQLWRCCNSAHTPFSGCSAAGGSTSLFTRHLSWL